LFLRFSHACGAEILRWNRTRLQAFGDDTDAIKSYGLDVITDLCDQLRNSGVPGIHFLQHEPSCHGDGNLQASRFGRLSRMFNKD
jgi:5,10-methylenetetrahydrofolate reductase